MNKFELEQQILHSPFDLETHKKTFINYFEAVILPSGAVEYAIPSHQEYLRKYVQQKFHLTDDIFECADLDVYQIWCRNSGLIMCWSKRFDVLGENPTNEQILTLATLIKEGLTSNENEKP